MTELTDQSLNRRPFEPFGVTSRAGWKTQVGALIVSDLVMGKLSRGTAGPDCVFQLGLGSGDEQHVLRQFLPACRYVAVEPNEHSLKRWRGKYAGLLIEGGVAETSVRAKFWSDTNSSSLYGRTGKGQEIWIDVYSLDDLLARHGPFGQRILLWADCEGAELPAMRGGKEFMQSVDWVWIETSKEEGRDDWQAVSQFLGDLGFRAFWSAGCFWPPRWLGDTFYVRR